MRQRRDPAVATTVIGASLLTTLGTLPVFLLSAQSVLIRSDLGFGERKFGIAVGTFFAAAAIAALLGSGLADRLGRRASTVVAGLLAGGGGLGVAWGAYSWPVLVAAMAVLGVSNAACQVTANLAMAQAVPVHRRGLAFGLKQSAIPLSIVFAGFAVPTVSATYGWRATFLVTGLVGLVWAVVGSCLFGARVERHAQGAPRDRPPTLPLLIVMLAIAYASAAANSLGSFVASWGFEVGLTLTEAAVLMAAGSGLNIAFRLLSGHLADRRQIRHLPVVAAQMLVGAVALLVLSVPSQVTVIPAALVAFAIGWSWPGLLLFAVVRIGRDSPAKASGAVQAGAFAGGAAGPVAFGFVVEASSYETAWRLAACLFFAAALLVILARRLFIADLVARPPRDVIPYDGGMTCPGSRRHPRLEPPV